MFGKANNPIVEVIGGPILIWGGDKIFQNMQNAKLKVIEKLRDPDGNGGVKFDPDDLRPYDAKEKDGESSKSKNDDPLQDSKYNDPIKMDR